MKCSATAPRVGEGGAVADGDCQDFAGKRVDPDRLGYADAEETPDYTKGSLATGRCDHINYRKPRFYHTSLKNKPLGGRALLPRPGCLGLLRIPISVEVLAKSGFENRGLSPNAFLVR